MAKRWTRDELLLALNLYHQTPFGKQDTTYKPIQELAKRLDRTPGSIAMKLNNFTSLDPVEVARGIKGLQGASQKDRAIWAEYEGRLDALAEDSEGLLEDLTNTLATENSSSPKRFPRLPQGPDETHASTKVRRHQSFFRKVILGSYLNRCCISGLPIPQLLRASHIIPWSQDPARRLDPSNGLCLAATYDAAFDRGLISVSNDYRLLISTRLKDESQNPEVESLFLHRENSSIQLPGKNLPSQSALAHHRENLFSKHN